jgi:hypothetical protein
MRLRRIITIGGISLLLLPPFAAAQTRPDLSGTWEWQGAEGVSRDGVKGPVRVIEVSGGAFNCGKVCTIVQTTKALTVSRPADDKTPKRQDVVLAFGATGSAKAEWDGENLVVTNSMGVITTKQTLIRQGKTLIVTSVVEAPGADASPVVQTYIMK